MAIKVVITQVDNGPNPGGFTVHWEARNSDTNEPIEGVSGVMGLMIPQFPTAQNRLDSIDRELQGYFSALKRDYDRTAEDFAGLQAYLTNKEFEV